jgi:hypothetical protein
VEEFFAPKIELHVVVGLAQGLKQRMSGGRISWFLVGAATGSLCYYATDTTMLSQVGKAEKRAGEIREELIGFVAAPVKEIASKVKEVVITPLQGEVKSKLDGASSIVSPTDVKGRWNKGVQDAFNAISSLIGSK